MSVNIAIDGPAGAGKSSIAKMLASTMNYIYVDTGAMYRTLAVYFLEHDIDGDDEAAVVASQPDIDVSLEYENGTQQIFLNGENVTSRIRTPEVTDMASRTSAYAKVREKMVDLQRKIAAKNNVVMDGRDIGTVVLRRKDLPDSNHRSAGKPPLSADAGSGAGGRPGGNQKRYGRAGLPGQPQREFAA